MKIRRVSAEDAEAIQSLGPGWSSEMVQHLGKTEEISRLRPDRCELSGGWEWMMGLLEASDVTQSVGFPVGLRCCMRFVEVESTV